MSVIAASILLLATAPQQTLQPSQPAQTIRVMPSDRTAITTMWRFRDNEQRALIVQAHHQQGAQRRAQHAHQRAQLAERLDDLISSDNCPAARRIAEWAGYSDIENEVDRVCDVRDTR